MGDVTLDDNRRVTASNVRVLTDQGPTYVIEFDLEWREAFRKGEHWNATWVFLKINPAKVEQTHSQQDVLERLVEHSHPDPSTVADVRARARAEIERVVKRPGFAMPERPAPIAAAVATVERLETKLEQEAAEIGQSFEAGLARFEANLEDGHEVLGTTSEASAAMAAAAARAAVFGDREDSRPHAAAAPLAAARRTALRLQRHAVTQGNHEVEKETEFAFLSQSSNHSHTLTTFTQWEHLPVAADGHQLDSHVVAVPTEDGMGVFIHPAADGRGPLSLHKVRLCTDYVQDGKPIKVWVGVVEMVHIPAGDFHVGDPKGADGPNSCFFSPDAQGDDKSFVIHSEAELSVGHGPGQLCWDNHGQMGPPADIPAAFPKGHQAYYVMKHQVTQGEYADFINHLRGNKITIRFPYGGQGDYRYTVFKTENSGRACTRPERACNWMSWTDAIAYAWWAGLRPMTELEYEKACRGPLQPVAGEYAWGSTTLLESLVILGDENFRPVVQGNAHINNTLQSFRGGDGGMGPVPDDAFRASAWRGSAEAMHVPFTTNETFTEREECGSSYYEVMALTGNLWEYVVSVGTAEGRRFIGEHGNGRLNNEALPDSENLSWPGADNRGIGFRGGSWYTPADTGRVADRRSASGLTGFTYRSHDTGMRCARTAPSKT
ncbi:MAG: SUMF1/EgtB/PvdO family nonheme iron enzyme [Deltaproteobacteria bacterium]|nr:SUMF1/EgtB/PvdO family nonheme iron enzyme [Deltaproteobacteria bacterium]